MNEAQRDLVAKAIANTVTGIWVGAPIGALSGKITWWQVAAVVALGAAILNIAQDRLKTQGTDDE